MIETSRIHPTMFIEVSHSSGVVTFQANHFPCYQLHQQLKCQAYYSEFLEVDVEMMFLCSEASAKSLD